MEQYRDNLPLVSANLLRVIYVVGSAIILQLYLESMGASPFQISLIEVVFWAGMLLMAPLWGALSDASGRRKIFLAASILLAALIIPLYIIPATVNGVLGLRFVFAVAAVAFPPAALAAMSSDAASADRGEKLAPYNTSRAVGFLIGWGGAGVVLEWVGFQYTFYLLGGVGIVGFVAAMRIRDIDQPEEATLEEIWENAKQRWVPSRDDELFTRHGLNYLYAGIFLRKAGIVGLMSLIAVYAVSELGIAEGLMGMLLALNPLSQMAFIHVFGELTDMYGRRKVFLIGFLSSVPIPLLLLYGANIVAFGAAFVLLGFSFAALVEGSTAFIGDVAPESRQGEFMGFRKSSQGLAGVSGPLLAGFIATRHGFDAMLLAMAALIAAAVIVAWYGAGESLHDSEIHDSMAKDIAARVHGTTHH